MKLRSDAALFVIAVLITLTITGCNTRYRAPVEVTQSGPVFQTDGRTHRVNAGETLYSVAWVYNLNYSQLAAINKLSMPFIIYPGQILNIDLRSTTFTGSSRIETNAAVSVNAIPANRRTSTTPLPERSALKSLIWLWPADGEVINHFAQGSNENKGINISGKEGDVVVAAASGEVVYAGRGLLRLGKMIIIKHNEQYLSAYAHNSRMIVSEGEQVLKGQKIAELGSSGINRNMLHFEIRLAGLPVDPLLYLPRR